MPLRYVRKKLSAENALTVAVATTAIGKELADLLQFPPARAATGILFLIFQTIQVSSGTMQDDTVSVYALAFDRTYKLIEANAIAWPDDV